MHAHACNMAVFSFPFPLHHETARMKVFHCDHCQHLAFFENVRCVKCGHTLAYVSDLGVVGSLDPAEAPDTWKSPLRRAAGRTYRLCQNSSAHGVCNWALDAGDKNTLCLSCRLTRVFPNLSRQGSLEAWAKLEAAKRRLVYTLLALNLELDGLVFEFLADPESPDAPKVMTGHDGGVVTINIAEADDAERERRKAALREPYRTILGHLRHESGHFYFDRLIQPDEKRLAAFRAMFGDERLDYAAAVQRHYDQGPPADWPDRHVSAYATMHPWEDWAETWAHYLHMADTLETASDCGLSMRPQRGDEPSVAKIHDPLGAAPKSFDTLLAGWHPLTYALNNLNRGLGLPDAYPFVLSTPAIQKLRFIHDMIRSAGEHSTNARESPGTAVPG